MSEKRTINIVVAALGGEGGGVLANWIADIASSQGWVSQMTSVAGVAQRTGATIYYIELFPEKGAQQPVMSLFPTQGDVDIVIASEIGEAGRMVQRGFVSPERTTLIASDHRVYGITEKSNLGDGTIDPDVVHEVALKAARNFIHFDMLSLARLHGTVISATLLGALAGSDALPFERQIFEDMIRKTGLGVEANLAAFAASFERAQSGVDVFEPEMKASAEAANDGAFTLPAGTTEQGKALLARIRAFPEAVHEICYHGVERLVDYQDFAYADEYLDRVQTVIAADSEANEYVLSQECARHLALWMSFEDIARVAQIKTRASRMQKLRKEVLAADDQYVYVTEFFRPQVDEIVSFLSPAMAEKVLASKPAVSVLNLFTAGKRIRTNTVSAYLMLRFTAGLRHRRRKSWIYAREHAQITRWFDAVLGLAANEYDKALSLAKGARMIKGYGATRHRTSGQMTALLDALAAGKVADAAAMQALCEAALSDDEGKAFAAAIAA